MFCSSPQTQSGAKADPPNRPPQLEAIVLYLNERLSASDCANADCFVRNYRDRATPNDLYAQFGSDEESTVQLIDRAWAWLYTLSMCFRLRNGQHEHEDDDKEAEEQEPQELYHALHNGAMLRINATIEEKHPFDASVTAHMRHKFNIGEDGVSMCLDTMVDGLSLEVAARKKRTRQDRGDTMFIGNR